MSDSVKIIFDGDLGPLQAKQAIAKGELNAFVAESEAEIKGISAVGATIGATAQKGAEDFTRYYKPVIVDLSRQLGTLGAGFEKILGREAAASTVAGIEEVQLELKRLNNEGYEASATSEIFENRLKSVKRQLVEYQFELAAATQENIFFAESEVAAAEAGKLFGGGARPLQGYGGLFRATGLTNAGINETEANAALNIIDKLGISVSSLVVVGGVAALGAAAIAVSHKIAEEEEHRLELAEKTEAAIYRQVQGLKDAQSEYERFKDKQDRQDDFSNNLKTLVGQNDPASVRALQDKNEAENQRKIVQINQLQSDLALNERFLEVEKARKTEGGVAGLQNDLARGAVGAANVFGAGLDPVRGLPTAAQNRQDIANREQAIERLKKVIADNESDLKTGEAARGELQKALKEIEEARTKAFDSKFEENVRVQAANRKFEEEQNRKFIQSVKEAHDEIDKLTKGYKDEFERLYEGANVDNPFAKNMIENAKSVELLNEKLKGASPELKATANALLETANAQKTYTLQITNAFQTIDLQAQADRFRNPTQRELQSRFNDRVNEFNRTSNSTNPDVFYNFQRQQQEINETNQRRAQEKIDAKLDIADKAKTDDQRAIADKAVTSFASSLNPDDLTGSERSRIAEAFERSAVRNEQRAEDSLKVQREFNQTLKDIKANGLRLSNIADAGGKQKLDITLTDDTSDKKATNATTATPSDVSLGFGAGPGGLTNR